MKKELTSWKPRSYQAAGVRLMISQAAAGLLWKPGLGKTSTVYMAARILLEKKFVSKILIIAPVRPAYNVWARQHKDYAEFAHLRVGIMHGADKEKVLNSNDYDMYVVNPEGLPWLFGATGAKPDTARLRFVAQKFDMLVVDESTKFKNSQTQRFKLLRNIVGKFRRRYILTGSFRPKTLLELFGQVYILDEGASLGRFITHYRNKFFSPSGFGGYDWSPMPGAEQEIAKRISPLVQVVEQEGNVDLPELILNDIYVDLPPKAMAMYRVMEEQMIAKVESGDVIAANAAVASGKCRQIANGAIYDENHDWEAVHDEKLSALGDLLEQLGGAPALVTYEFEFDAERISEAFKIPSISTGNAKRDDLMVQQFAGGLLPAVMGNPSSISLGTDGLQKNCCDIIMFGVPWSFLNYEQVIDRVKRSGNKSKRVTVHRILARGTVDERVVETLSGNDRDQRAFLKLLQSIRP